MSDRTDVIKFTCQVCGVEWADSHTCGGGVPLSNLPSTGGVSIEFPTRFELTQRIANLEAARDKALALCQRKPRFGSAAEYYSNLLNRIAAILRPVAPDVKEK